MKVRPFQEIDMAAVRALVTSILDKEFQLERQAYSETDLNTISQTYSGKRNTFLVAEEDDQVIGTVAIKEDDRETALLRRLFVDPSYRGKGYGSLLVEKALQFCRKEGYKKVVFRGTAGMAAAAHLAQKKGFTESDRIRFGEIEMILFSLIL